MTLLTRISKIEKRIKPHVKKYDLIVRIIVVPGNPHPVGYKFGDITILRKENETTEELMNRCSNSIPIDKNQSRIIFNPIF